LTASKDEAFGNSRALRRKSPGLHADYGAIIDKRSVPCSVTEPGKRLRAITNHRTRRAWLPQAAPEITQRRRLKISVRSTKSVSIQSYLTVARPTQADLRGLGTTDYTAPCCSKTHQGQTCTVLLYGKNSEHQRRHSTSAPKYSPLSRHKYKTLVGSIYMKKMAINAKYLISIIKKFSAILNLYLRITEILDSELSDECIDFTMFSFSGSNVNLVGTLGGHFLKFPVVFKSTGKNKKK
ncbi:Uncharacterized protein FWK35_00003650, partial [Aphis craccivora]